MAETGIVRVVSVDDHELLRRGVRFALLSVDDIELAGEAGDAAEALQLCSAVQPDVVLLDMHLPGEMDGPAAARAIHAQFTEIQIIALSSFYDKELVQSAMQAGAISYLVKGVSVEQLTDAIRAAHAGRPTLTAEAVAALVESRVPAAPQLGYDLTEREQDVLVLLVEGMSNAQIAERLVVSVAAVKYHVGNILSKLSASNRTEAAILALVHGLVSKGES